MNFLKPKALSICLLLLTATAYAQIEKKKVAVKRITTPIKIDGILDETAWKGTAVADKFVALRPVAFKPESADNASEVYFLYDAEGLYVGGYFHEKSKDSIAAELVGRDGFGNNDFAGVILDTYNDKLNGFEYFVTPLGEQYDAKQSPNTNGNSEDFSWNAVWKSAAKIQKDGWSFEMFIPYSAIRFGKKKMQDWGLNIVRRRQKSAQQLFWQPIDPNINGFLTQEGLLTGLEDIKPPLRLQFSPYFSVYQDHDGTAPSGIDKNKTRVNGGMDVKYGINQAFTLDMTLIPDFGQLPSDNLTLNLTPFEQKFTENRPFFTEGTELFSKGNLFYSRRIGVDPGYYNLNNPAGNEIIEYPGSSKILNATKISGRTQKGLGIAMLNAVTQKQYAVLKDGITGDEYKEENLPLTNYNILVLDQTLKHNSSISFVNTNVIRSGKDRDANVSAALFDLNDKKNMWNVGGNISLSNIFEAGKTTTGYAHTIYFGKTSGRLNFSISQTLSNAKYDKSDMGYFTNNNSMDNSLWVGYRWTKPSKWYNNINLNFNAWYGRLVTPLDIYKGKDRMYQNAGFNMNSNALLKNLWNVGASINKNLPYNDFYEARSPGRVFSNKGSLGINFWWDGNPAKKFSTGGSFYAGKGSVFGRTTFEPFIYALIRFNSKFSFYISSDVVNTFNQPGWADIINNSNPYVQQRDTVIFSRRDVRSVENIATVKYNFTNRMGLSLRLRHYWSKVQPLQYYVLNPDGKLETPTFTYTGNRNQNFNYLTCDMIFAWQFAQGSFINLAWKDVGSSFSDAFERNYAKNLGNIVSGNQFNSLSLKVIYFLDYLTLKRKIKNKA